jgi:hypothetical protein
MRLSFLALFTAMAASIFIPVTISADMASPNSTTINDTYVWRNVITTNDTLIVCHYNMAYNPIPAESIDNAFQFKIYDATNTTELGVVTAYNYQNKGYEQGVVSWYYYAGTAPPWGSQFYIHVEGDATIFTTPPLYSTQVLISTFSPYTATSEVKDDIAIKIIGLAKTIGSSWNTTQALTEEGEAGTQLSTLGEAYFRAAIPGIQVMAPSAFYVQIENPDTTDTTWSTAEASNYSAKVNGTTLGNDVKSIADLFGTSFSIMALIPVLGACVAMIIIGAVQGNILAGLINSSVVVTACSWGGWFPPIVGLGLIPFGCAVYIFFHLAFKSG